jgi:hypothetical protein
MFDFFKNRRRAKLRRQPLTPQRRAILVKNLPFLSRLSDNDRTELEGLIQIFLAEKSFEGCGGLELTEEIKWSLSVPPFGQYPAVNRDVTLDADGILEYTRTETGSGEGGPDPFGVRPKNNCHGRVEPALHLRLVAAARAVLATSCTTGGGGPLSPSRLTSRALTSRAR